MSEFVNPIEILNQISLKSTMIAADFGSGSGGWAIPLAKRLNKGKVFAVDVQPEPLSALEGKAKLQGVFNITKVIADVEDEIPEIRSLSCDWVLMTNLLFEVDDRKKVFEEAKRVLKPGGKILVVEWLPGISFGPQGERVPSEKVQEIARDSGFTKKKELKAGAYHYALVFEKA